MPKVILFIYFPYIVIAKSQESCTKVMYLHEFLSYCNMEHACKNTHGKDSKKARISLFFLLYIVKPSKIHQCQSVSGLPSTYTQHHNMLFIETEYHHTESCIICPTSMSRTLVHKIIDSLCIQLLHWYDEIMAVSARGITLIRCVAVNTAHYLAMQYYVCYSIWRQC